MTAKQKGKEKGKQEPIQRSVKVDCPIEDAFRIFTEGMTRWWPLAACSVTEQEAESCAMEPWEGGRVFERTRSGEECEWGTVKVWDPPRRVEFTWHPGARPDDDQTVNVEFRVEADGTRVTLTHSGWQLAGAACCALAGWSAAEWSAILEMHFALFASEQILVVC